METGPRNWSRRHAAAAGSALLAGTVLLLVNTSSVTAEGVSGGAATIAAPSQDKPPLDSGGTQTDWTITLPTGAACSGDTAAKSFHVYGYLVDNDHYPNPGALTYDANGPVTTNNGEAYPLVTSDGSPWVAQNTAPNTAQVINIPVFNDVFFSIDGRNGTAPLPAGVYNVGVACVTNDGVTDRYWNAQETFAADSTDPGGEAWTATTNPTSGTPITTTTAVSQPTTTTTSPAPTTSTPTAARQSTTTTSPTSPTTLAGTTATPGATSDSTTTTTPDTTTSTTAPGSTTTSTTAVSGGAGTSATTSSDPGATVAAASATAPQQTAGSSGLPFTGASSARNALFALGLVYVGYVAVLLERRRRLTPLVRKHHDRVHED